MIERRRPESQRCRSVPGIGAALDDLIDEAREALAFGIRGIRAGVNLDFRVAERRCGARSVVVERAVNGNAVELIADLVVVSAAKVDGRVVSALVRNDVRARNGRNSGV